MRIGKLRKINFLWGVWLIVLSVFLIGILILLKNKVLIWDFTISWVGSFGLFISLYLVRFCSKKTKYPFVLSDPYESRYFLWDLLSDKEWFWFFIFPLSIAAFVPIMYLAIGIPNTMTYANDANIKMWVRIVIILTIITTSYFNNLIYLITIKKLSKIDEQGFVTKFNKR